IGYVASIDLLILFRLCVSLADMKTEAISIPASSACSKPFSFGIKAEYVTSGLRLILRPTSRASFNAGIQRGCTKEEYSISLIPDCDTILINETLSSLLSHSRSFCTQSLGSTHLISSFL